MIYEASPREGRIYQGEIVSGLSQFRVALESIGTTTIEVDRVVHPYAVVLTQDCDLESDYLLRSGVRTSGKNLSAILFCVVVEAESLKKDDNVRSAQWKRVRQNDEVRYHYLRGLESSDGEQKLEFPALAMDFKQYFTIPTAEVYKRLELGEFKRSAYLVPPYVQHLSHRFANHLSRVALPENHLGQT